MTSGNASANLAALLAEAKKAMGADEPDQTAADQ